MNSYLLKLTFLEGLREVVLNEIKQYHNLHIVEKKDDALYLSHDSNIGTIKKLRSILNVYLVKRDIDLHPQYISNHKSVLGNMIDIVLHQKTKETFLTYKLSCAGSESKEVSDIQKYIKETYKLKMSENADLEIYIGKITVWEVGIRLTARPLSVREYRVENIKGGMNPTIAYAMNSFGNLDSAKSYLNIFSGSGTLLIEAGISNPDLTLQGFDIDGKTNALAVKNIKKAGLIKSVQLKTADIFTEPDFGMFDVIASDLPFGMQISKNEDLNALYTAFVDYCGKKLNKDGTLVVYTSEHQILEKILKKSKFVITTTLGLKVSTVVGAYLYPKVFVCKLN